VVCRFGRVRDAFGDHQWRDVRPVCSHRASHRTLALDRVPAEETIIQILDGAGRRFSSWLKQYRAWHGDNDITKSTLTFQVAGFLLESFPDGMAFMEVPFAVPDQKRTDRYVDACLTSPLLALLVKAKDVWAPEHISWIGDDISRITPHLVSQLQDRRKTSPPEHTHGLVMPRPGTGI
jgi:hypothetical protein